MKFLILVFGILFSSFVFAKSDTTMVPVSTQKVANASLTCPAKKWCNVAISISQAWSGGISSGWDVAVSNCTQNKNIILKSGEVISGAVNNATASAIGFYSSVAQASVTVSVGGVVIMKCATTGAAGSNQSTPSGSIASSGDYNFYSMEYYN